MVQKLAYRLASLCEEDCFLFPFSSELQNGKKWKKSYKFSSLCLPEKTERKHFEAATFNPKRSP